MSSERLASRLLASQPRVLGEGHRSGKYARPQRSAPGESSSMKQPRSTVFAVSGTALEDSEREI